MSNIQKNASPFTIDTQNTYVIGDVSPAFVGTILVHMVSASFSGSITVKARKRGTSLGFLAIPYKQRYLNGAVSDDSTNSTTAITGTSIIEINAAGLDIALDCTSFSSGSMSVDWAPVVG